jgi:hypothetical protein
MNVVIMQPTYLPWVGYFDLIDQADVFVFLDSVQFERQSWQQRNRIKTHNGPLWLTVPVLRRLEQTICEVKINNTAGWRRKHWLTLSASYAKAPYWSVYGPRLQEVYDREWESLAELNITLIQLVAGFLGLERKFVRTSEMAPLKGHKADMLIDLCERFQATEYLSPVGSREYLADDLAFRARGIELKFNEYEHPVWPQQFGEFVPYMSAIDLVLNTHDAALSIIRSGHRPSSGAAATRALP